METLSIELTNPLAKNLINDLESLNLIRILKDDKIDLLFMKTLNKLKNKKANISIDEIVNEVDAVRTERYFENNN